jgi:membrane associated rhomboid family serine protease
MIPIGDSTRSRTVPYVNIAIIVANFIVFFYELYLNGQSYRGNPNISELDHFIYRWGNIPACTFDAWGWQRDLLGQGAATCALQDGPKWTILTAMFMHGGWLHILGNMLFLWIFGDNVEDAMGHVRYAVFYVLAGVLAGLTHGLVSSNDLTPAIGASGAIAGVMGAYIVLYPRATVVAIIPLLFFIPFPVPAILMIGFWFLLQIFSGASSLGPNSVGAGGGVAYFAHIGGFIAGAVLVRVFVLGRPRGRPRAARMDRQVW